MIKEIISYLQLALFGDKEKMRFILQLQELSEQHPEFMQLLTQKSKNDTKYLDELYKYHKAGGDVLIKLSQDLEGSER